jgi:tetratricopeptide (TPR) repeat protein
MLLRFSAERQILANLNHPNIARLLDGGITADGLPYLVMEYVDGIPIDVYARSKKLTIEERLKLFVIVCAAVEYAHKNLVVHRDIKPGNILVTVERVPKLLDFGIAKLLGPESGAAAPTRTADRMMTPEYASPEQVRGDSITTSSDVYALGILLYELLVGKRPFHLDAKSPLEALQIVCERDPEPPSRAIRATPELASADAPAKVGSELDNIVLMAMRKEPGRRYASVAAFSHDVQAYLQDYPVHARTDNFGYRSRKFVRRHRVATAAGAVGLIALLAFSIGMGLLAQRADRARALADQQRLTAQHEADFLASIFNAATPDEARGRQITARDLLDQGVKRIDEELAGDPDVQSAMLDNVGYAYYRLGIYDQAQSLLERAYNLKKRSNSADRLGLATSAFSLATVYRMRGEFKRAEPYFREALAIRQQMRGPDDSHVAEVLDGLGQCLHDENRDTEAESVLRSSLEIVRKEKIDKGDDVRDYLAQVLERRGDYSEARQLLREAVEISGQFKGADSQVYLFHLHNLAGASIDAGDLTEAEATERQALAVFRHIVGDSHPDLGYPLNNLGWILLAKGDWKQAEPVLHEALEIRRKGLGEKHPLFAASLANWARVLQAKGDYAHAEEDYRQALEIAGRANGPENWTVAKILSYLGLLQLDRGDFAGAERYARQALEMRRKLGGEDNPDVATSRIEVAVTREFQHDPSGAESLLRSAFETRKKMLSPGNPDTVSAEVRLGEALVEEGKPRDAEPLLREAVIAISNEPFPMQPWQTADANTQLGICLLGLGRNKEGETLLRTSGQTLKSYPQVAMRRRLILQSSLRMASPR